jgi:hypothetical protein
MRTGHLSPAGALAHQRASVSTFEAFAEAPDALINGYCSRMRRPDRSDSDGGLDTEIEPPGTSVASGWSICFPLRRARLGHARGRPARPAKQERQIARSKPPPCPGPHDRPRATLRRSSRQPERRHRVRRGPRRDEPDAHAEWARVRVQARVGRGWFRPVRAGLRRPRLRQLPGLTRRTVGPVLAPLWTSARPT